MTYVTRLTSDPLLINGVKPIFILITIIDLQCALIFSCLLLIFGSFDFLAFFLFLTFIISFLLFSFGIIQISKHTDFPYIMEV